MNNLLVDARHALRSFGRSPGLLLVALLTLALSIGATTCVFSIVNTVMLRPLPYPSAGRLVGVGAVMSRHAVSWNAAPLSVVDLLRRQQSVFDAVAAYEEVGAVTVSDEVGVVTLRATRVDTALLRLLGAHPQRGRLFAPAEIQSVAPVAIVSDSLWRTRYARSEGIINSAMNLDGRLVTVIGVLQSGFRFSDATDVWFPLDERADSEPAYRAQWYGVVARLKRGIAPDRAAAEVDRVGRNFAGAAPSDYPGFALQLRNSIVPRGGGQLLLVSSLVGLLTVMVFGIACTNVGNLIAVRAVERSGEMAVRAALGASPRRLLGMHLIEASMLAAGSGMLGAGFAWVGIRILVRAIRTGDLPSWLRFGLDIRVLLFACGITACTVLLIGLIPARRTLRTDLLDVLGSRAGGTLVTDRVARSARRSTVLQVSLALAAFVSAALLARSYLALQAFRHGYDAKGVLIATATGVFSHTTISEDNARSIAKVVLSNNSIDGVALAGPYVSGRASSGDSSSGRRATDVHLYLASQPTVPRDRDLRPTGKRLVVSDGYFALLHIPIVAGRAFGAEDVTGGGGVAVVSQRIATTLWPAENAVGQTFRMGVRGPTFTVVGVAGDVRDPTTDSDLGPSSAPWPHVYFPMSQAVFRPDLYVRSRASPATVRALIQSAANAVASNILVRDVQSLGQASASSTQFAQTMSLSVGTLAVGAGLLAIIGVYGVIAYGVALRRREIGLRIALGATPRNVVWLFTWRGARTIAIGIVVGLVLALATSAILAGLVWNVSPFDPLVYVASTGVFLLIGLLACWLPARRAASVQPVEAMRMV